MKKRSLAALALALLLMLSGCSLVDVDEEKAAEIDNNKIIIEYNGTDITKEEVTMKMTQYCASQGTTLETLKNSEDTWDSFKEYIINQIAIDHIALDKAKELGLDQLTDDEQSSLDQTYDYIDSTVSSSAQSAVDSDSSLDYDTEYQTLLNNYLSYMGYQPETYKEEIKNEFIINKVQEYYIKDITVTDDEVRSDYDTELAMQKNNIDLSPDNFNLQAQWGGTILYYPAGYMKVRHILISFDDDTSSKALDAYSNEDKTEYNQIVDAALPSIQSKIDEVISKMDAGEDFATLIDDYNDDSTMDAEPTRTDGQVVGPYSSDITIPGYIDAVAKLTKPGDYTLLNTYSGCYIIRCEKLLEGAVSYDDVKDTLKASLLSNKQTNEWSTVTQGWLDDATAAGTLKTYPDRY